MTKNELTMHRTHSAYIFSEILCEHNVQSLIYTVDHKDIRFDVQDEMQQSAFGRENR